MNFRIRLILLSGILCLITSVILIRHYLSVPQNNYKDKIAQLNEIIKRGVEVQALYDSVYTEYKHHGQTFSREFHYSYIVNGKSYRQELSSVTTPQTLEIKVYYLPENPDIQSLNPQKEIEHYSLLLNNETSSPTVTWYLFGGSICVLLYLIIAIRKEKNIEKEFQEIMNK